MTATSGRKCAALLRKSNPVGSWLKMCLASSRWRSMRCYLTWKPSATPQGRLLFRLVPSMPRTAGRGSGLWRTPSAQEAGARVETLYTKDGKPAMVGERAYRKQPDGRMVLQSVTINQQVQMWPTPRGCDAEGGATKAETQGRGWFRTNKKGVRFGCKLKDAIVTQQGGGSLNPQFVSWLMGFPLDWCDMPDESPATSPTASTNSKPSATPSSPKSPKKSGA